MMGWLLKYEGYPPGVLFTLVLHGGILLFIYNKQLKSDDYINIDKQQYLQAVSVQQNPQKLRTIEINRQQQQQQTDQRKREQERQAAAKREAEQKAQQVAQAQAKAKAEAEQKQKAETERVARANADKQKQAQAEQAKKTADAERQKQAAEAERQRQISAAAEQKQQQERALQQQNQATETNLVSQYAAIIQQLIERNWVIPPNARNGMLAVVEIRMTPVGDIISHKVIRSSGDVVFDRSVEQAIDRVESFPELRDLPIAVFERNFRVFTLNFAPEDLLR